MDDLADYEPIEPDTDIVWTGEMLARAWEMMTRPVTEESEILTFDPDDYPVY